MDCYFSEIVDQINIKYDIDLNKKYNLKYDIDSCEYVDPYNGYYRSSYSRKDIENIFKLFIKELENFKPDNVRSEHGGEWCYEYETLYSDKDKRFMFARKCKDNKRQCYKWILYPANPFDFSLVARYRIFEKDYEGNKLNSVIYNYLDALLEYAKYREDKIIK